MGLYHWNLRTEDGLKGSHTFSKYDNSDPNFALAYAYLADTLFADCLLRDEFGSKEETLQKARKWRRGFGIRPELFGGDDGSGTINTGEKTWLKRVSVFEKGD